MKKSVRLFSFVIVCLILIGLFVIVGVIAEEDSDQQRFSTTPLFHSFACNLVDFET